MWKIHNKENGNVGEMLVFSSQAEFNEAVIAVVREEVELYGLKYTDHNEHYNDASWVRKKRMGEISTMDRTKEDIRAWLVRGALAVFVAGVAYFMGKGKL